ncbi:MAG: phosphoglycerate mutase family protein [Alistipes sp.]|nr:phosphoglycerate mutase family protein [Alistipes sp.]
MERKLKIAGQNLAAARELITLLDIEGVWASIGARANLIGSVYTGLMAGHLDIDYHVYSRPLTVEDSFRAVSLIASRPGVYKLWYGNLIDTEEECIEWHLNYRDEKGREWKIDMIHILEGSRYDGHMERFARRLTETITPEQRDAVISIKFDIPAGEIVPAIYIYMAVVRDGIRDYGSFIEWKKSMGEHSVVEWMP